MPGEAVGAGEDGGTEEGEPDADGTEEEGPDADSTEEDAAEAPDGAADVDDARWGGDALHPANATTTAPASTRRRGRTTPHHLA